MAIYLDNERVSFVQEPETRTVRGESRFKLAGKVGFKQKDNTYVNLWVSMFFHPKEFNGRAVRKGGTVFVNGKVNLEKDNKGELRFVCWDTTWGKGIEEPIKGNAKDQMDSTPF